ncbi:MAG: RHS repeat-associated core domain-containing protein, partial [Bacillota bacterium]
PSDKTLKTIKQSYTYDAKGNKLSEYKRGNGTGSAKESITYQYDALDRVISSHESFGNSTRGYQYDSLGNLTYETTDGNKFTDYKYNILNQMTYKTSDLNGSEYYTYEYDSRGNLVKEILTKANKTSVEGSYVYNEMNKLSMGTNNIGETSSYVYNGLGYLVQNVWEIKKNAYGYQEIQSTAVVPGQVVVDTATGKKDSKEKKSAEVVLADPELNKKTTVTKDFVLDYTRNLQDVLYETETGNLNYRYGYGLQRLSATISPIDSGAGAIVENGAVKLYYHQDYLGTTDYLTSDATGKVVSWTMYNEWGEITHNAVLKCGLRELDLVKNYTGYEYDPVLGQYYAKNRMYDAENRRFTQLDPAMDGSNWYVYVGNNPVNYVDPLGLDPIEINRMDGSTATAQASTQGMFLEGGFKLGDSYTSRGKTYIYNTLGYFQYSKAANSLLKRYYVEEANTSLYLRFEKGEAGIDPVFKMRLAAFARDNHTILFLHDAFRSKDNENYSGPGCAHSWGVGVDAHIKPFESYMGKIVCETKELYGEIDDKDKEKYKYALYNEERYENRDIINEAFKAIDMKNLVADQSKLLIYGLCKPWNNENPYYDPPKWNPTGREGWHLQPIETIPEGERNTSGGVKYPTAHSSANLKPFYDEYTK